MLNKIYNSLKKDAASIFNFKQNKELFQSIRGTADKVFKTPEYVPATETFEQSIRRQGLTQQELQERAYALRVSSWLLALAMLVDVALCLHWNTLLAYAAGIGAFAVMGAHFFKCSLWAYQIKHRKLGAVSEWLHSPQEWLL